MTRVTRFAWLTLGFNVVVILLGALVRATGSGAGCGRSWPTCQGEVIPVLQGATAVEFTHRAASGVALILVLVLMGWVLTRAPRPHPARLPALLAGVAILVEAGIGAVIVLAEWVGEDASLARVVAVPLHLVNTLFLLAALTLTVFWLRDGSPGHRGRGPGRGVVAIGAAGFALVAASGAVTALADTLFPKGGPSPAEEHFLTGLRVVHPVLAVTGALMVWWLAARGERPGNGAGPVLPWLLASLLASGVLNIALGVPLWSQLLHLLLADLLWIGYVWVSAGVLRPAADPQPS